MHGGQWIDVAFTLGGGGWFGLGQGLCRTPRPTVSTRLCADTTGLGESRLSGPKACRTVDRPRTPRWHSREGDAAVPVCVARMGRCAIPPRRRGGRGYGARPWWLALLAFGGT